MESAPDVRALLDVVAELERWQDDPERFAALLADDVVLVNAVGRRVLGRRHVLDAMRAAMATPLAGVMARYEVIDARPLGPGLALVIGTKHLSGQGGGAAKDGSDVAFSVVLRQEQGSWAVVLVHNTLVQA